VSEWVTQWVYLIGVNRVVTAIIPNVKITVSILFLGSLFVTKRSLTEINYWPDGLGYNDVTIAVNKIHNIKRDSNGYKINE
jgi:hypothetical protein